MRLFQKILSHGLLIGFFGAVFFLYLYRVDLFPQWFGSVEGRAANWAPIGLVVIGGLTTSTFLTLIILPTIYSLIDDLARFGSRVAAAARARPAPTRAPTSAPGSNPEIGTAKTH